MAKQRKRISINAIDKVIDEAGKKEVEIEWNGIAVTVIPTLTFTETLEFVNDVVMSCIQDDSIFVPEAIEFAIKSNTVLRYSNLSLPDNLEHRHHILYNSDIYSFVYDNINVRQHLEITNAIEKKLSYMLDTNVQRAQRQLSDLVDTFENMQQKFTGIFEGISSEDVANITKAVTSGALNEEKLVRAYIDQTRNSDAKVKEGDNQ